MARILIVEDEAAHRRRSSPRGSRPRATSTTAVADGQTRPRPGAERRPSTWWSSTSGCPGSTASSVLDQLRAQGSRVPVIVLTARDSVTDTVHRARGRRRRLHAQAVPVRRAAGPGPAAAAPGGRPGAEPRRGGDALRPAASGSTCAPGGRTVDGNGGRPVGPGVHAAGDLPAQPRPGAVARAAARPRVGLRLRPGLQRRRRLRRLPAPQARRRPRSRPSAAWATASTPLGSLEAGQRGRRAGARAPARGPRRPRAAAAGPRGRRQAA